VQYEISNITIVGESWKDKPKGRKEERTGACAKTEKLSCKLLTYLLFKEQNLPCKVEKDLNIYKCLYYG
jgi:hypothetical protein